jgi:dihydropteroate synthase
VTHLLYFCLFTFAFMHWQTSRRKLLLETPLVMAILNVTPDSFSDGSEFLSVDDALRQAEKLISDGADIIDIGGESTRPNSEQVSTEEEIRRVVPVIEAVAKRFDTPISVDTTKSDVAKAAVDAGAEIINDISGLRFDERIAEVAARHDTGLVVMHSRGTFETMHSLEPVADIIIDVSEDFRRGIAAAETYSVKQECIALDIGIGFSKTFEQNLELLAKLDKLVAEFADYPMLVGTSRKSFIGKILGGASVDDRLSGSLATAAIAVWNGVKIIRAHDVRETVEAVKVTNRLLSTRF